VATYVALLRAVNLGSTRRVPMATLRETLTDAGYEDVRTHLQSGNVLLSSPTRSAASLGKALKRMIEDAFGIHVDVAVRSGRQITSVARSHPFGTARVDAAKLHVAFLTAKPTAAAAKKLRDLDFGREQFVLRGTEIYLHYPNGLGRSKMTPAIFERTLRIPATVRTWRVVNRLAELAAGPASSRSPAAGVSRPVPG